MPVTATHLEVAIRGTLLGQKVEVVQWYRLNGAAFATATVLGVLEAYWNHIKTDWRDSLVASADLTTDTLFAREPGASGQYAEFVIPTLERIGTRPGGGLGDFMPPFNAVAMKLTVGSGTTRPGQKRFWGLCEGDQAKGILSIGTVAEYDALSSVFASSIVLGVPVATGEMFPQIVRYDQASHTILASQDVTGSIVNVNVSSQNSRKIGRGQ